MVLSLLVIASAHAAEPVRFELGADGAYVPTRQVWSKGQVGGHFSIVPVPMVAIRLEGSGWGLQDDPWGEWHFPEGTGKFGVAEAVTARGALAVDFSPLQHSVKVWRMPWTLSAGGSLGFGALRTVDVTYNLRNSDSRSVSNWVPDAGWYPTEKQVHPELQLGGMLAAKRDHGPGIEVRAESVRWVEALDATVLEQRQMFSLGGGLFVAF